MCGGGQGVTGGARKRHGVSDRRSTYILRILMMLRQLSWASG